MCLNPIILFCDQFSIWGLLLPLTTMLDYFYWLWSEDDFHKVFFQWSDSPWKFWPFLYGWNYCYTEFKNRNFSNFLYKCCGTSSHEVKYHTIRYFYNKKTPISGRDKNWWSEISFFLFSLSLVFKFQAM